MAADLLPCPFCGGSALLDNSGSGSVDGHGNSLARVWCTDIDCKTHGTAWLEEWEAVKVWNRRVPPIGAAPAPSAMATGEALPVDDPQAAYQRVLAAWIDARAVVRAAREVCSAWPADMDWAGEGTSIGYLRNAVTAYDQRNHDAATPPATPGAVTVTDAMVEAACSAYCCEIVEQARADFAPGKTPQLYYRPAAIRAAIAAALAAAASVPGA